MMARKQAYDDFLRIDQDDLRFGQRIGGGGFGDVFKGTWISRRQPVAIKKFRISMDFISSREMTEIMQEINIMHQIKFPHVLSVFGVCMERDCLAMIVELMPLGSLHDVLHNTELTWSDRWSIAHQMTKAINYLHQWRPKPIIHCDIKSPNFLMGHGTIDSNDRFFVKVGDFGLAKFRLSPGTRSTWDGMCGTLPWQAPELFRGKFHSKASDVFSLGICLWEVATSLTPYEELSIEEILHRVVLFNERLGIPCDVPNEFSAIIESAWEQDSDERPTCLQLLKKIEEHLKHTSDLSCRSTTRVPPPCTTYSNPDLENTITETRTLSTIELSNQSFVDADMIIVGIELTRNLVCRELSLCTSDITATGVAFLTIGLPVNSTLELLNLSGNPLEASGVANLARVLPENRTLTRLYLNFTDMGDEGAEILARVLRDNQVLESLAIAGNGITKQGVQTLCEAMESNKSLKIIQLDENVLGDEGAAFIGRLLIGNKTLQKLYMRKTGIGNVGYAVLMHALGRNSILQKLFLAHNVITDQSVPVTIEMVESNRTLKVLNLHGNLLSKTAEDQLRRVNSRIKCDIRLDEE